MKIKYKANNPNKGKTDFDKMYFDIDEYIIKKCDEYKVNWRKLNWDEKMKMARKFGCEKEFIFGMYGREQYKDGIAV